MGPDYKVHDPRGWCGDPARGAALGRGEYHPEDPRAYTGKLALRKVRLSGDYDQNGTYWGYVRGWDLYWCASEDNEIDWCVRGTSRADARAKVIAKYPNAKVRR